MNHAERMALDRYITREPPDAADDCPVCKAREAEKQVREILEAHGWDVRKRGDGPGYEDFATEEVLSRILDGTEDIYQRDGQRCREHTPGADEDWRDGGLGR
jgi:hypothetical protein